MPKDYRPDTLHRIMDTVDKLRDIHGRKVTAKDHHAYEAASKESRPATAAFESDISNLIRDATDWQEFTKRQGERGSHERWYTTPLHMAIFAKLFGKVDLLLAPRTCCLISTRPRLFVGQKIGCDLGSLNGIRETTC